MPKDSFGPVRERFSLEGFRDFFKDSADICRSPADLAKVEKWDRLYVPANWNEQDSDRIVQSKTGRVSIHEPEHQKWQRKQ